MKYFLTLSVLCFIIQTSVAPPVTQEKKEEEHPTEVDENEELGDVKEYHRYLQEVIQALESDPDFRAKLEKAETHQIRNGDIAEELRFVNHRVRNKLDELKRTELERLKKYYEQVVANGDDVDIKKIEYMNHRNPHTFEIEDLKKLIAKTAKDLDEADKKRREKFKEYEMNKKYDQEQKMKEMKEEEKKKYEDELHDLEKKHKEHEPLHHPGSKKQLEEVWEKQDHMENQDFDPKTFFYLHDLDGNGVWDQDELKALFLKELDKLYAEGHPEDDVIERAEEMERMREHVINEVDVNKDGLISYEEFLAQSKKEEFEEDPGWEALDQQQIYSEQEYEAYRQHKAKEIEQTITKGMFPPHPNQVYQDNVQQVQYQNQIPQYNNQIPPQQGQYNQIPVQQGQYVNQMPQQQQFPNPNQIPVPNNINQPQQQNYPVPNQQVPISQQQIPVQQVPVQQMPVQQLPVQQVPVQQVPVQNVPVQQVPVQQVPVQNVPVQNVPVQQVPSQQIPVQQVPVQQVPVQQVPVQQVPVQQYQQPQQIPGQPQFQQPPPNMNAIPQNVPVQQQFQQPPPNLNSIPQQQLNVPVQSQPNAANAANFQNQQLPVVNGQNLQNTQQVPQQAHEQLASINSGQVHQNLPNHV